MDIIDKILGAIGRKLRYGPEPSCSGNSAPVVDTGTGDYLILAAEQSSSKSAPVAFWGPGGKGQTTYVGQAGRFNYSWGHPHLVVPVAEALKASRQVVLVGDFHQFIDRRARAETTRD